MRDSGDTPKRMWERIEGELDIPSESPWKTKLKIFILVVFSFVFGLAFGLVSQRVKQIPLVAIVPQPVLTLHCGAESIEPKEADGRLDAEMSFVEYPEGSDEEGNPGHKTRDDCTTFEYKLKSDPKQTEESDPQSQN